jgi:hypothetical protein
MLRAKISILLSRESPNHSDLCRNIEGLNSAPPYSRLPRDFIAICHERFQSSKVRRHGREVRGEMIRLEIASCYGKANGLLCE